MTENKPTMLTYIKESPSRVKFNLDNRKALTDSLASEYINGKYNSVLIVACGSSSNASMCAKPFMQKYLDTDVQVVTPATFLYQEIAPKVDVLCVVISQTGCSTNSIQALDKLQELGKKRIGITGNANSDFKDHTDLLIDYGVGEERVGYVTKGVTTLVEFLMLFSIEVALIKKTIGCDRYNEVISEFDKMPSYHEKMQELSIDFYERHRKELTSLLVLHVCGFEQSYGVSLEAALKVGETVKIPSFAYEAEEYIHGPNLQLTPNYSAFIVDDYSKGHDRLVTVWKAISQVTDHAFMLTNDPAVDEEHACRLPADKLNEPLLAPLFQLEFFQYISYRVTTELNGWEEHPLMSKFKEIAASKTANISKFVND